MIAERRVLWPAVGLGVFLAEVVSVAARPSLFRPRFGRAHRALGGAYLFWLCVGAADVLRLAPLRDRALYDACLGALGIALTLSAWRAFGATNDASAKTRTVASGPLDETAVVTASEMLEHAFYQGLNLAQIAYLHACDADALARSRGARAALALLATSPWLLRGRFPVNSFSANWRAADARGGEGGRGRARDAWSLTAVLYRLKKWQYVLYKHALLHGLNASVAARGARGLASSPAFRLYWVALNAAYTHEFFLQTLVRRGVITQARMLRLNQALMVVSTAAALQVLARAVVPAVAALSLVLNFTRRHRELTNTAAVVALALAVDEWG